MHSLETGITGYLNDASPQTLNALRIEQNNRRFAEAIRLTWGDSPDSAEYILAHINSLYVAPDEEHAAGPADAPKAHLIGVYLDEPTARAELNARRETVAYQARQQGLSFSRLVIHYSKGGMRERHAFPDAQKHIARLFGLAEPTAEADEPRPQSRPVRTREELPQKSARDQADLMEALKRGVCLAFTDYRQMHGFVDALEGVFFEVAYRGERTDTSTWHYCHLFVCDHQAPLMRSVVETYGPTLASRCRDLGLFVRSFYVHPSSVQTAGQKAYPTGGAPRPMPPLEKREAAALRARYRAARPAAAACAEVQAPPTSE
ncbi:hypothetical protein GMI69_04330 [Eggerthellaceae bacterium zg-887]|uniref:hypothetical protein n=1 Tax=Xiamenia xianingshaonis TaxID=2682776 RepID=UPI00140C0CDC|nr:hypothetical protein [Xiamenia xianingshaonis]NHM15900.1 hypothetical protein [Xiamenia xianingshaonis]